MNIIDRSFDNSSLIMISRVVDGVISGELVLYLDNEVKKIIDALLIRFKSDSAKRGVDLKWKYKQKRYSVHCSIKEPKGIEFEVNKFAIRAISSALPAPKSLEVPPIEAFEEEIPQNIKCQGIPFLLSEEIIMNMKGERDINHQIDLDLLKWCLKKKVKAFRNPKSPLISLYFRKREDPSRKVLNIIVRYHQNQEKDPFVVLTAYWMAPMQFKGRRGTDEYGFGLDYNQILRLPESVAL